jgi:hypothetical protein
VTLVWPHAGWVPWDLAVHCGGAWSGSRFAAAASFSTALAARCARTPSPVLDDRALVVAEVGAGATYSITPP